MISLESERLSIREIAADDLEKVLPVHLSNPDFLEQMEGSEGQAGLYDLERWQRDWYIAQMMPGRHMLACYLKENDEAMGYIDYMEENEGKPWLGVLTIHRAYQRQGFGSEAFARLAQHFREAHGWSVLVSCVLKQNEAGRAFAHHLGFRPVDTRLSRIPTGVAQFMLLEYAL